MTSRSESSVTVVPPHPERDSIEVVRDRRATVLRRRPAGSAPLCAFGRRGHGLVAFAGDLDAYTGPRLEHYLAADRGPVRLDLRAVTFMDSSGLETLERVQQRCRVNGWSFTIECSSPAVERLLQLVGLDHDLTDTRVDDAAVGSVDGVPSEPPAGGGERSLRLIEGERLAGTRPGARPATSRSR
jgi:anti-anti-sigma factor